MNYQNLEFPYWQEISEGSHGFMRGNVLYSYDVVITEHFSQHAQAWDQPTDHNNLYLCPTAHHTCMGWQKRFYDRKSNCSSAVAWHAVFYNPGYINFAPGQGGLSVEVKFNPHRSDVSINLSLASYVAQINTDSAALKGKIYHILNGQGMYSLAGVNPAPPLMPWFSICTKSEGGLLICSKIDAACE